MSTTARNTQRDSLLLVLLRSYYSPHEQLHYVESPHLDIVRAGREASTAQAMFNEALGQLLEEWHSRGISIQCILEAGFSARHNEGQEIYFPPELRDSTPPAIDNYIDLKQQSQAYRISDGVVLGS